ncbi:adenosine deaminase [Actinotalea sp. Marseille-Q4924]|uniref:adenosine deaminase n=1 Tax=Actinotalea sp. Marseille-Q4924 TaxID=2866571 RepID=UPI001CE4520A|nr:adenosine deaminase [Actinotalea sp. Marseille-Q4924]
MTAPEPTTDLAALPKVLLHDHLDGGLRPGTVLELADAAGYELPASDEAALRDWFVQGATSGSLERYLETFRHTVAVMQTADALRRVAREAVLDLAADGVVHAEQRYAPELHLAGGLEPQQVVDAVRAGLEEGVAEVAAAGGRIGVTQVLTTMRPSEHSTTIARLALANRDAGVVALDLAGPEAGHPAARHAAAFRTVRYASFPTTVHAGEGAGVTSIAEAVHLAGALRIGHGVRLIDDVQLGARTETDPWGTDGARLGHLAHWVRDQQIPLEVCPTSNVQTGASSSIAEHPITPLARLGFAVTVNTDNRLMSGTSMTQEYAQLVEHAGWGLEELRDVALTAGWSAFLPHDQREALVEDVLRPAYTPRASGRHRA